MWRKTHHHFEGRCVSIRDAEHKDSAQRYSDHFLMVCCEPGIVQVYEWPVWHYLRLPVIPRDAKVDIPFQKKKEARTGMSRSVWLWALCTTPWGRGEGALLVCRDWVVHQLKDDFFRWSTCQQGDDPQHSLLHNMVRVLTQLCVNKFHDLRHLEKEFHKSAGVSWATVPARARCFLDWRI